ncbi:MAG: hypothetical protein WAQ32_00540 [Dethiobacteria bacterium]|nr:hypothetical protein [Bacillota bacterium]NMD33598.1 hypothetical protein [Bacillota bacterium]HOB28503.1 hypothetical protein [Bacillota bacterium]HPZ41089.1 hypothetical protein [Bacillota bacterium]HQD52182.1 hypothetical protein [Bacillota bacterium]
MEAEDFPDHGRYQVINYFLATMPLQNPAQEVSSHVHSRYLFFGTGP